MLTSGEVQATQHALDMIAAERDALMAQAGISARITSAFTSIFTGADPASTVAGAAARVSAAYDAALDLRNAAFESPDDAHEEALQIVEVARRISGVSDSIATAADKAGVSGAAAQTVDNAVIYMGEKAKAVYEQAISASKWLIVGLVAVAVILIFPYAARAVQGGRAIVGK